MARSSRRCTEVGSAETIVDEEETPEAEATAREMIAEVVVAVMTVILTIGRSDVKMTGLQDSRTTVEMAVGTAEETAEEAVVGTAVMIVDHATTTEIVSGKKKISEYT